MRRSAVMAGVRWAFPCARWAPGRDDWSLCARCVQPEEKQRIAQFMFTRDAKAAMAGRLLIRKLITEKLQIPWDKIVLDRTAKGKPFLVNGIPPHLPTISFNVSHQGDYAVLAAESELQVGVDVMKTDRPGSGSTEEFFRIMQRQFTEREWLSIRSSGSDWRQLDMFYRHWALKESFIKAIGVGLGFNLQRIEFEVYPVHMEPGKVYTQTKMKLDDEDENWFFEETLLDENHHVAVAIGGTGTNNPPTSQSPGPDEYPRVLKEIAEKILEPLSIIFEKSWRTGEVPEDWRRANVVPIFKKGKKVEPENYRPEGTLFTVLTYEDLMDSALPITPEDPDYWENFHSKQELPRRQNSTAKADTVT